MQPFARNYSIDMRFYKANWLCECKAYKEDENHLLSGSCPIYKDIRDKYGDIESDTDLVNYFNDILARREERQKIDS